jgi:hypothetical protein
MAELTSLLFLSQILLCRFMLAHMAEVHAMPLPSSSLNDRQRALVAAIGDRESYMKEMGYAFENALWLCCNSVLLQEHQYAHGADAKLQVHKALYDLLEVRLEKLSKSSPGSVASVDVKFTEHLKGLLRSQLDSVRELLETHETERGSRVSRGSLPFIAYGIRSRPALMLPASS